MRKYLIFLIASLIAHSAASDGAVRYKPVKFDEELVAALAEYDRQMYDELPDRIDCEIQSYLENCNHINFMLKKHPDAPMRVPTSSGTEVVLQPDTPAAFVDFILSPGQESAQKTLEYWRDQIDRLHQVSDTMLSEVYAQGGITPGNYEVTHRSQPRLSEFITENKDLRLTMIVESSCPSCKYQLSILKQVIKRFPDIEIMVYQIDGNVERFNANIRDEGIPGQILPPQKAKEVLESIKGWPYTRVKNKKSGFQEDFYGSKTVQGLVQEIAYVSKYTPPEEEDTK